MNREEIKDLLNTSLESGLVPSVLADLDDLKEAVVIAKNEADKAYSSSDSDNGDRWAKMVMMLKIHSIRNLKSSDKLKFISTVMRK